MTCFGLFDWPSSGSSILYTEEKTISERGLAFTNVKYNDHLNNVHTVYMLIYNDMYW
jgi:hypothetical protein